MTKDYNDGKWHGWNGGECPVHPESRGDFVFADSAILHKQPAGAWDWADQELPIIAFRITEEYKEPREVYEACGLYFPTRELAEGYVGKYTWSPSIDTTIKTYREVLD